MKTKLIELITFDKNQNLKYNGKCEIIIDVIFSMFLVEPENEGHKMISAMFEWDFIMDKNILFVFAENKSNDFALVFDKKKRCKKVYDFVCKNKPKSQVGKEEIFNRFLCPVFQKVGEKDDATQKLKSIFSTWINSHNEKEKEGYLKCFKNVNVFDLIHSTNPGPKSESKNATASVKSGKTADNIKIKQVRFDVDEQDISKSNISNCSPGNENIKPTNDSPSCSNPKSRLHHSRDQEFVYLPDFELQINLSKTGKEKKELIIFDKTNRSLCYFYAPKGKYFCCRGCYDKNVFVSARLCKDADDKDYVVLSATKHVCEIQTYSDGKNRKRKWQRMSIVRNGDTVGDLGNGQQQFAVKHGCVNKIIKSSEFITVSRNSYNKIPMVVVFTSPARDECYEFSKTNSVDIFRCLGCAWHHKHVSAQLRRDENGRSIFKMLKEDHICTPRKFIKEKFAPKIVPADQFELLPNSKGEKNKKMLIFTSAAKDAVYEYFAKNDTSFYCLACVRKKRNVLAKLIIKLNGEKYVECSPKEHVCEPQKFESKNNFQQKTISSNMFEFQDGIHGGKDKFLTIFTSDKKEFCRKFYKVKNGFYKCIACFNSSVHVSAKVVEDGNGIKSLKLSTTEHVCLPQKGNPSHFVKGI